MKGRQMGLGQAPRDRYSERPYDIVLFGATGFTGGLTAEYLARYLPPGARWAIAGRNETKLEAVRKRLARIVPSGSSVQVVRADATRPDELRTIAGSTRVVATTVGPYLEHGEPLVAACAELGTDYVDLTGEPEFIDRMYLAHHATAQATGARLVHACGFDSVPHDLGAFYTLKHLPTGEPIAMRGVVRTNAAISGGTLHSALGQMARALQMRQAARDRRLVEARTQPRRAHLTSRAPHWDKHLRLWLLPLPTVDPVIVARSAEALPEYGPAFTYSHYVGVRRWWTGVGLAVGIAVLALAAQIGPVRRRLGRRIPQGDGPSAERRARSSFSVDFIGESGGVTAHTRVAGGDPGYDETAKMLAQAAMCLAFDDNPMEGGQLTTAAAMGDNLLNRLINAGIDVTLVSRRTSGA